MMQKDAELLYPELSYQIRGACFDLYKDLGSGHKEVIYQRGLTEKLRARGLSVEREKRIPVTVDGKQLGAYTPDMVINNLILIELKASSFTTRQDTNQFWHYLRVTPYKLGFLINFGKQDGVEITRRVYDRARR